MNVKKQIDETKIARLAKILHRINVKPDSAIIRDTDIAKLFNCSATSVRRDLNHLRKAGINIHQTKDYGIELYNDLTLELIKIAFPHPSEFWDLIFGCISRAIGKSKIRR